MDVWLLASSFALLCLLAQTRRWQWQAKLSDFHALGNLSTLLLVAFLLYFFISGDPKKVIYLTAQMMPVVLFPLLLAQLFSTQEKTPLSALFYSLRKSKRKTSWIDLRFSYIGICLMVSGTTAANHPWYYIIISLFIACFLFSTMEKNSWRTWISRFIMVVFAVILGYFTHLSIHQTHTLLDKQMNIWITQWLNHTDDGLQTATAMGKIGQLKLSDRIILRMQSQQHTATPLLLRTASFDRYMKEKWFATKATSQPLKDMSGTWTINKHAHINTLKVFQYFNNEKELLALPLGTNKLSALYVDQINQNRFNTLTVHHAEGFAAYNIHYNPNQNHIAAPQANDLIIPENEQEAITSISKQLQLNQHNEKQILAKVANFLHSNFQYSTWLQHNNKQITPLSEFLLQSRRGHCEYFASATVLLLRQAGIPARYVMGYAVQERDGDMLLARGRDAHAWAMAYVQGQWIYVDNTPADWFAVENADRSAWQWLSDAWQKMMFLYQQWRLSSDEEESRWWLWLLLSILSIPAWRIVRNMRMQRSQTTRVVQQDEATPSSPFQNIDEYLQTIAPRQQGETLYAWVKRIQHPELKVIIDWHYRLRFHPAGLNLQENKDFETMVESWLSQMEEVSVNDN